MKISDIINFNYEIKDEIVYIHCNCKGVVFGEEYDTDGNLVSSLAGTMQDNHVVFSWSVPIKEIEGLEDPTDYLKQAIAEANS